MRIILTLLALAILGGCGDSSFPNPTGTGSVRAINAIKASPDIIFRIEERSLGGIAYKFATAPATYDDFEYDFNFDAKFPDELQSTRIATETLQVAANRDYTFVLTGALATPDLTVWETDVREFAETDTVFQARFAHLAESLGELDIYFAAPGVAPVAGAALGTLSFREVLSPIDFPSGPYVVTLTPSGDPATIIYQSASFDYAARNSSIIPIFDSDETDTAPYNAKIMAGSANVTNLPDDRFPPTVRFLQSSLDLPPADIYDDEMLTNLVLANQAFGDASGDLATTDAEVEFRYTPAGNTGAILFSDTNDVLPGTHNNFLVYGTDSDRAAAKYIPDRRSVETLCKVTLFQAASNHEQLDVYFVVTGVEITDEFPRAALPYATLSNALLLPAGSYDIYLTPPQEKTIVAGPVNLSLALGDAIEIILQDTVDPTTATINVLPPP